MLKKIVLATFLLAVVGVGAFAAVAAMQPAEYRIERSVVIAAPPSVVFAQVNDFHKWEAWSPWAKLDPNATNSFEGPSAGEGAVFKWSGKSEVGEGQMTLTESRPDELVRIKLDFVRPFEDTCATDFAFRAEGSQATVVTWTMAGHKGFVSKAVCLFMDMDKVVGGQFAEGLANMKAVAERAAR